MDRYKKLLWLIFKEKTEGCDIYHNHGSIWLILTDEKKWVIELTKEGTLWYNYYFFKDCFRLLSLDVTENQNYITEWIENFIQNGVKDTYDTEFMPKVMVDDTIQNGVKDTKYGVFEGGLAVEEVIQNGVKKTFGQKMNPILVGDIIKNGINETHDDSYHHKGRVEGIINNRVKETNPHFLEIINPINFEPVIKEMKRINEVNIVLEKGIKEVKELPDKSGELRGYGEYYQSQEDRTKPHTQYVDDVIRDGIKETKYCELHSLMMADHIIRDGIKETWGYEKQSQMIVNEVIRGGIKETNWRKVDNHPTYLDRIIKN
jgi:hypothetical protein